jgi:cyanophycinase-like exopeptidase
VGGHSKRLGGMSAYYAFLFDRRNHIIDRLDLEFATVSEAVEAASACLRTGAPQCETVEIWHGTRMMRRIERSVVIPGTASAKQKG